MLCPRCHADNREGRRFCGECGQSFALLCPSCGFVNEGSEKFCGGCGAPLAGPRDTPPPKFASPENYTPKHLAERILTSKAALEGERKQVTVLFVDVSGFTALSARLDPEDVHALMTRAFELMLAEVHRYEGTVNQFLGDGIMALFGAPIAHEDHAQRAVRAALGIQRALENYRRELERERALTFKVRQGLNSGLVVVGSIGSDLRMDYTAVGDTTNVAARLQQGAESGHIVIGETTYRLVADYFDTRPLGELSVRGKAEPIRAWTVEAAREGRTRLEAGVQRGLTPLVGRGRELEALEAALARTRARRRLARRALPLLRSRHGLSPARRSSQAMGGHRRARRRRSRGDQGGACDRGHRRRRGGGGALPALSPLARRGRRRDHRARSARAPRRHLRGAP